MTNDSDSFTPSPVLLEKSLPPLRSKKKHWGIIFGVLFLLILAAIGIGAFWFWTKYELPKQARFSKEMASLKQSVLKTQAQLQQQTQILNTTQQALQHYQQKSGYLQQADYLVRLAAYNLTFENNAPLAAKILQAADAQLQISNNLAFLPLRQAIAADIADLNAVPSVDIGGLITTLNALSEQIERLPRIIMPVLPTKSLLADDNIKKNLAINTQSLKLFFTTLSKDSWQALKTMVVIHHNRPEAAPLLPPDQYVYVVTNIQSQLALAKWAIVHQQGSVYTQSLVQAVQWINRYFPPTEPAVKAVLQKLNELIQRPIQSPMPDLSRSLQAIQKALDNSL